MKVVIHGTKGGYKSLNSLGTFNDVRPDNNKTACIGQKSYSIQYFESNVVFSKYLFIRDVLGDKRTGNIAFSLVIPQSKKLSGENIVIILDKISEEFNRRHIDSDNLDSFREDWTFVEEVIRDFDGLIELNREKEIFSSGSRESGYLYFNVSNPLKEYFNSPYHEEYASFKQVFLIDSEYIGKDENPLNALRHDSNSDLTDIIDLNKYTLKYDTTANNGNSTVKVTVNGIRKTKLSLNEPLKIEISEIYKETESITLSANENSKYIKIDDEAKIISVHITEFDLKDNFHDFKFKIQNENGEDLNENFEIYYYSKNNGTLNTNDNGEWSKSEYSYLKVKERELTHNYYFIYLKTISGSASSFIREIKKEDSGQIINIKVRSSFKINIRKEQSNIPIDSCEIKYDNKIINSNFINFETPDEIRRIFNLKITHSDYDSIELNNYYIIENSEKTIYLPKNKIKIKDKTKSTEKTKDTNVTGNGTERKKKEKESKNWIIFTVVFIILFAVIYGLVRLDKWEYKAKYEPVKEEIVEVEPVKPVDDATTAGGNKPKDDTAKPKDGTEKPKDGTEKPKDDTEKPKDDTEKPKGDTEKPKGDTEKPKGDNEKTKGDSDLTNIDKNSSKKFEKEFLKYIQMSDPKIDNFQKLLKKVTKKNFKYYDELKKISKKSGFDKFINNNEVIDRLNANNITDIKF